MCCKNWRLKFVKSTIKGYFRLPNTRECFDTQNVREISYFYFTFIGRELILQLICWLGTIFLRVFHFGEISEWQHLWTKKRKWNCNPEMHISNILQRMGGGTGWEEGTRSNMEFADDSFFIIHWNWKCLCDLRCLLQFVTSRLFQRTKASEDAAPLVQNKNW